MVEKPDNKQKIEKDPAISKQAKEIIEKIRKRGITYNRKRKPEEEGEDEEKPPAPYFPFLVMKNNEQDNGHRPLDNPSWGPDCIRVETYQPNRSPGEVIVNPEVGKSYQIRAIIHNLGLAPSYSTFVEFYWMDSSNSGPIEERIHQIGVTLLATVEGGSSTIVRSDEWIPVFVNEGHECLVVRAYDPILDPISPGSFSQVVDRHVGQRNVHVVEASAGSNAFSSFFIWLSALQEPMETEERTIHLIARSLSPEELVSLINQFEIKGLFPSRRPPVYSGLITREQMSKLQLEIPDIPLKSHLSSFERPDKKLTEKILPLPTKIDDRFARIVRKSIRIRLTKDQEEKIWIVQAIPFEAEIGEVFGMVVSQWVNKQLVGKISQIAIVK